MSVHVEKKARKLIWVSVQSLKFLVWPVSLTVMKNPGYACLCACVIKWNIPTAVFTATELRSSRLSKRSITRIQLASNRIADRSEADRIRTCSPYLAGRGGVQSGPVQEKTTMRLLTWKLLKYIHWSSLSRKDYNILNLSNFISQTINQTLVVTTTTKNLYVQLETASITC